MHHSFAIIIILAAPFVAAQSLSSIPSCALPAVEAGIQKTGCGLSATCICAATSFLETVKQQISTVCSAADQETTINTAQQYCSQAGVPLAFPSSPSPSRHPVSARDSVDDVLILPLGQLNDSLSAPMSSSSSIPFPMTKTSSSPTNSSPVSLLSILSSIPTSSTGIAPLAANTLPPALIMPVGTTCPPPSTVTFYTTTTLSPSSASPLASSSISPSQIPVSTFSLPISFPSPSAAAAISLSSAYPSLFAAAETAAAAASSSSISPSPVTLTSTILTVSSTSTLTLYSTLPLPSPSPPAAPYAMPNISFSGMNTTNTTNTTAMPFTGAAAANGGRIQIGWATFAVVGVGAFGLGFL